VTGRLAQADALKAHPGPPDTVAGHGVHGVCDEVQFVANVPGVPDLASSPRHRVRLPAVMRG